MALIRVLSIGADGLETEHDPAVDSVAFLDVTLNGSSLTGTGGVDVIGDLASAYTYISPAGNTLQDTLNAIDSYVGTLENESCMVGEDFTNGEATPITLGKVVYISGNNEVKLAKNDDVAKDDPVGLVGDASIAAAAIGKIWYFGCADGVLTGATAGTKYFLDSVAGGMTATVPTGSGKNVVLMGYAKNATDLFLRIQNIGKRA